MLQVWQYTKGQSRLVLICLYEAGVRVVCTATCNVSKHRLSFVLCYLATAFTLSLILMTICTNSLALIVFKSDSRRRWSGYCRKAFLIFLPSGVSHELVFYASCSGVEILFPQQWIPSPDNLVCQRINVQLSWQYIIPSNLTLHWVFKWCEMWLATVYPYKLRFMQNYSSTLHNCELTGEFAMVVTSQSAVWIVVKINIYFPKDRITTCEEVFKMVVLWSLEVEQDKEGNCKDRST